MRTKILQSFALGVVFGVAGCSATAESEPRGQGGNSNGNHHAGGGSGGGSNGMGGNNVPGKGGSAGAGTGGSTNGNGGSSNGGSSNGGSSNGGFNTAGGNSSGGTTNGSGGTGSGGRSNGTGGTFNTGGTGNGGSSGGMKANGGTSGMGNNAKGGNGSGGTFSNGGNGSGGTFSNAGSGSGGKSMGGTGSGGTGSGGKTGSGGTASGGTNGAGGATGMGGSTTTTCNEAQKSFTSNAIGEHCGYTYEYWKDSGTGTLTVKPDGFSVNWSNIGNLLGRKGIRPGNGNLVVTYDAAYTPNGNSYLCVYGWTKSPLVEYYIVDSWGSWKPPGSVTSLGTVTTDGGTYDIYKTQRVQQPSIEGTQTFYQYWSVRQSKRTSGTITVANHFAAWASKGMNMGSFYEVSMTVEGYQSSGTADVKMSIK